MNYIYDILLNFNKNLYEVYEWNKNDEITHIRKIPLFKITTKNLYNILNNKVKIDEDFLKNIYKKTETFLKNKINVIDYCFLVTDGKEVVALKSNEKTITGFSKLLYEEELDVLEYSDNIKTIDIKHEILSKINLNIFETRNENNIKKYIFKNINEMINNNDYDKLNYIYLECFNQKLQGDIKKQIYIDLKDKWDDVYLQIYDFFKKNLLKR